VLEIQTKSHSGSRSGYGAGYNVLDTQTSSVGVVVSGLGLSEKAPPGKIN